MKPGIIFEDSEIIILDKPPGWIVNKVKSAKGQPIVEEWLGKNYDYETIKEDEFRNGIVHRLDKETSGVMIVAKTKESFKNLQSQFKKRQVKKRYKALAHGKVEPEEGSVEVPVGRLPWNRKRFGVLPGGKRSKTEYKVEGYYKKGDDEYSLATLFPETGRTHQIRIHLKYLKHPIVSDEFYAGRKTARRDRKWCPRLFLHASQIGFQHPKKRKEVSFDSELSSDLKEVVDNLEQI